jgi:hypothetical protein
VWYKRRVTLVDLRGREHEPEVRRLLDPRPGWLVVGWSRDERLVACAGLERTSHEELALRALGASDDSEAAALLDAVAAVATAARLVAGADERLTDVYRECGFVAEGVEDVDLRWVRSLEETHAPPGTVRSATLAEIEAAIRSSWGRDTSDDPEEWSTSNPARGQCAVTALLVRELLGGEIVVANVLHDGRRVERHAWNRLPSGLILDLTRDQFRNGERFGAPVVEEPVLAHRNPERLATLRARVQARLELG